MRLFQRKTESGETHSKERHLHVRSLWSKGESHIARRVSTSVHYVCTLLLLIRLRQLYLLWVPTTQLWTQQVGVPSVLYSPLAMIVAWGICISLLAPGSVIGRAIDGLGCLKYFVTLHILDLTWKTPHLFGDEANSAWIMLHYRNIIHDYGGQTWEEKTTRKMEEGWKNFRRGKRTVTTFYDGPFGVQAVKSWPL